MVVPLSRGFIHMYKVHVSRYCLTLGIARFSIERSTISSTPPTSRIPCGTFSVAYTTGAYHAGTVPEPSAQAPTISRFLLCLARMIPKVTMCNHLNAIPSYRDDQGHNCLTGSLCYIRTQNVKQHGTVSHGSFGFRASDLSGINRPSFSGWGHAQHGPTRYL